MPTDTHTLDSIKTQLTYHEYEQLRESALIFVAANGVAPELLKLNKWADERMKAVQGLPGKLRPHFATMIDLIASGVLTIPEEIK